jgi:hypothetical protein
MSGQWNRFLAMAVRDSMIIAITLALWLRTIQLGKTDGIALLVVHLPTAALTVISGYLVHEWGHLIGAWLIRSSFLLPASVIASPFLFRFDNVRNTRRHFLWMAGGGFVSSGLLVVLLLMVLPRDLLAAQLALAGVAVGVLATLVIEVPGFWRVYRGAPLPSGAAYVSSAEI